MTYARWYGSLVALPNGQLAIFGGRQNVGTLSPCTVYNAELYDPALGAWTPLTGATSSAAFGDNWWYPRSFVAPGGNVFVLTITVYMYFVSTAGAGSITQSKVGLRPETWFANDFVRAGRGAFCSNESSK